MRSLFRRTAGAALATMLFLGGVVPSPAQGAQSAFADTAGSYAEQEIDVLAKAGIFSGYEDGTFQPGKITTRAEAAKAMVLAMGLTPDPEGAGAFRDVASDAWYRGYVGALAQSGIAQGLAPDRFAPGEAVSREQLIVFFIRALGMEEAANELRPDAALSDYADIADWARPHVALAVQLGLAAGIVTEDAGTAFRPKSPADRQTLARLTYEYFVNRDVYASRLAQWGLEEEEVSVPNVTAISVVNRTTMRVILDAEGEVGAEDFRFEPELAVLDAVRSEEDGKVVVLTTAAQSPGTVYKLLYKGRLTGLTATGAGAVVVSTGGGRQDPDEQEDIAALLAGGGTLADAAILASGIYGPSDESGLTTTIEGTLTVDPGPDGEVELRNINPDRLEVLSGKDESIKLMQTVIKELRVNAFNNNGRDVRIEVRNGVQVESVSVESQAILETTSPAVQLGKIVISAAAAAKSITLRGSFDSEVTVNAPGSSIKLESPGAGSGVTSTAVRNLILNAAVTLAASGNTRVSQVHVGGAGTVVTLEGDGRIEQVTVDASATGAKLEIGTGANIGAIKADADIVLSGDPNAIIGANIEGEGSVSVDDSVKEDVKAAAVGRASEAIDHIEAFTVYSDELQADMEWAAGLVEAAKGYGALESDIPNLDKLKSIEAIVQELKEDVRRDIEALEVGATVTGTIALPVAGSSDTAIVWISDNEAVIRPDGTVTRPAAGEAAAVVTLSATVSKLGYSLTRAFDVTVPAEPAGEEPDVTGLVYDSVVLLDSAERQLTIEARYSDDTTEDITALITNWTSSNPAAATVSAAGLLTAVASGTTVVSAQYNGFTATFEVTVLAEPEAEEPTVVGLTFSSSVRLETAQHQLTITARYSNDTTADVTALATDWRSSNSDVVTVSPAGLLTAVSNGFAIVTAQYGGLPATFVIIVSLPGT